LIDDTILLAVELKLKEGGTMTKKEIEQRRTHSVAMSKEMVYKMSYKLTSQQFRLSRYMVSQIKPTDAPSTVYTMSIADYCEVCGIDDTAGKNYKDIREAVLKIDEQTGTINKDGKWKRVRWFDILEGYEEGGTITYSFHREMIPLLFDLINSKEGYLQYISGCFYCLKQYAAQRLYEMLIDKSKLRSKVLIVSLDELKSELNGENYTRYQDFRRNIIDKAIEEINKKTDIRVSYKPDKPRGITKLYFFIEVVGVDENEVEREMAYNKHYEEEHRKLWEDAIAKRKAAKTEETE
jgi:plasmid replication initiation protein